MWRSARWWPPSACSSGTRGTRCRPTAAGTRCETCKDGMRRHGLGQMQRALTQLCRRHPLWNVQGGSCVICAAKSGLGLHALVAAPAGWQQPAGTGGSSCRASERPPVVAHSGHNAADVLIQPLQADGAGGQLCGAGRRVGALLTARRACLGLWRRVRGGAAHEACTQTQACNWPRKHSDGRMQLQLPTTSSATL